MRRTIVTRDPEPPGPDAMRLTEQQRRREWFREHWTQGIAFNQHCGIEVRRWDDETVELFLPYAERLSAHPGIFHGGVVSRPGQAKPSRRSPGPHLRVPPHPCDTSGVFRG